MADTSFIYFRRKASSWIFDWALHMPMVALQKINKIHNNIRIETSDLNAFGLIYLNWRKNKVCSENAKVLATH